MKTITVNIVNFNCIDNDKAHNVFHIREDSAGIILTDVLEIHFLELTKLNENVEDKDVELIDCLCF